MKHTFFGIAVALLSLTQARPALAQTEPVEMLDQGACWIQAQKESGQLIGYKIASFGSGISFGLYTDEFSALGSPLKTWIQNQIKSRFPTLPASKYEVGFHCYSSGHTVTIQIERPGAQPICINAKAKPGAVMNDLESFAVLPDASFNEGNTCLGIEERTLGVSLKKSDDLEVESLRVLIDQSPNLKKLVEKIEYRSGSFFALLRLKPEYAFREVEAKAILEADGTFMSHASNLWLNSMSAIEGEDRILFQGKTSAY